jgi:hypothetical protein
MLQAEVEGLCVDARVHAEAAARAEVEPATLDSHCRTPTTPTAEETPALQQTQDQGAKSISSEDTLLAECWHRFDDSYVLDERYAGSASTSFAIDPNWYLDTGATDHVTEELEKLAMHEKYKGKEQIHSANGAGMRISHIGHSVVNTPSCKLMLKNVLHVPKVYKNRVSVYRLTKDNSIFLKIHPDFFLIKDQVSRKILLSGCNHRGLYPIPNPSAIKQILAVFRPLLEQWYSQLGHPSHPVVAQVISHFNLPVLDESNKLTIYNACQ